MTETLLPTGLPEPAPAADGVDAGFWQAAREHRLDIQRCRACGRHQVPPEWFCHRCHSKDLEWATVSGVGRIYSYIRVHHPVHPALKSATPYLVVLVELIDADGVKLVGNLLGPPDQSVPIGATVQAVFEDHTEGFALVQWCFTEGRYDAQSDPSVKQLGPPIVAAYHRFFAGFNARDAAAWSASLNYPHVRLSARGTPEVVATPQAHAGAMSWDRVTATGWDHSRAKSPVLLHVGRAAAHVLGGWTRHTKEGQAILENSVLYVVTQVANRWGIQARFGIDAGTAGDESGYAAAVALVEDYIEAYNDRDWARATRLMHFPAFLVEPGAVRRWESAAGVVQAFESSHWHLLTETSVRAVQGGAAAVNVAVEVLLDGGDRRQQAIFFVCQRDARWGIQARSIIEA